MNTTNRKRYQTQNHNTPRVNDAVYIDGKWTVVDNKDVWVKAKWSRVNGIVCYVDRDSEEAAIKFTDHPYADKDEPKIVHLDFSAFYDRRDRKREMFVLTDDNL